MHPRRLALLMALGLLAAGCPGNGSTDDDDVDVGDDDDDDDDGTEAVDADGDGYTDGEDCDDSDPAVNPGATEDPCNERDDDCDGEVDESSWPGSPSTSMAEITNVVADGGEAGGDADVYVYQSLFDEWDDLLCTVRYRVQAQYAYGPGQGDDLPTWGDEILEFEDVEIDLSTCPTEWLPDPSTLAEAWRWRLQPLVFVSCEQVAADPVLGGTYVGSEDWWDMLGDGTFDFLCDIVCTGLGGYHHGGPCEGIWLAPGAEDDLEYDGDFAYFSPASTANVEVWRFQGFLMAEPWNDAEDPEDDGPTTGLQGEYRLVTTWPFEAPHSVCP